MLEAQAHRLTEAIAAAGHSPSLLAHLASIEERLARVQDQIRSFKPVTPKFQAEELRSFVLENAGQLSGLLRGDVSRAKGALMNHVQQLVLTPTESPNGPIYAVSGSVDFPAPPSSVMPMVARDGIGLFGLLI